MADLTADGSTTPAVIWDPSSGNDEWKAYNNNGAGLYVQKNQGGGGYDTVLLLEYDGTTSTARVVGPPGNVQLYIECSGTTVKLRESSNSAAIWLTASYVQIVTRQLYAPEGVSTSSSSNPIRWNVFTGQVGATSPVSIDLGYDDKVVGATVVLEYPATAGRFGSIPLDSAAANLGLTTYYEIVRNPAAGNDVVKIYFDTAQWASTKQYKVLAFFQV